ncbi:MAG: helix-turn-helix transcriptional regulator [Bacteroidaceae bacterium]|nr:helix-turn-helix transcriptional regulator [Bacteroidaceae bacterium]
MLHIGNHIKRRLEELERSPAWLAKKINCDRTNIYKIFNRSSIDTELLARISKALEYDFFIDLSKAQENSCDNSATEA